MQQQGQAGAATSQAMGPSAGGWVLSLLGMVGKKATQQRHLLHLMAHAHLRGRALLPGNPLVLPLLGRSCLFQVLASAACSNSATRPLLSMQDRRGISPG